MMIFNQNYEQSKSKYSFYLIRDNSVLKNFSTSNKKECKKIIL